MEPALPRGSLAVVQPAEPSRIVPGVTIVFADRFDPTRLIAHRVVRALPGDPPRWETKGDANRTVDAAPVPIGEVRGIVGWAVPGLGFVVTTLRGAPAVILLVGLPLALLAVTEISDRRRRTGGPATPSPGAIGPSDQEGP
jgi:signal peptidase I